MELHTTMLSISIITQILTKSQWSASNKLTTKQQQDGTKSAVYTWSMNKQYTVAKVHLSFSAYTELVELQILDMGTLLFSDHACANIIEHLAHEMRQQLVAHIKRSGSKLSVMLDESTSLSSATALIVC